MLYSYCQINLLIEVTDYSGYAASVLLVKLMSCKKVFLRLVQRLYTLFNNKNSVIGARVDKYLRAHFGYGLPESNVLGRSDILCNIDDTFQYHKTVKFLPVNLPVKVSEVKRKLTTLSVCALKLRNQVISL